MSDLLSGLANLTKQVTSNISTYEIRKITERVQDMVMSYTETESLVREATNEDPWGPTGPQMKDISNQTFQYDAFSQIMDVLWKRMLEDNKFAWRRVYKSLTLLNYLLQHGSERVIANSRDHVFQMRSLEHYKFVDEKGKDQGVNIRHRAGIVLELLGDDEKLRAERKKAKGDNKERYQGFTSDDIKMGRGGSYNPKSSSSFNDFDNKRKPSFEDGFKDDYSHKEVNSFQFQDGTRRNSVSPELGFRQEQPEADDDGFGDFAQARTTSTPQAQTAGVIRAGAIHIPALAPPTGSPRVVAAPSPVNPSNSFDLLGLDTAPAPVAPSNNVMDLFAPAPIQVPPTMNNSAIRPPRPPSGGGLSPAAAAPAPQPALIDDIFGAAPVPSATPAAASNANGLFVADWSAAPSVQPASTNNDFANFDAFSSLASASAPVTATTTPAKQAQVGGGLDDLFGGFTGASLTPQNAAPVTSVPMTAQAAPKPAAAQAKIGSTWAGTGGLIDLDNLGGKSSVKQSPSLNQIQMNKQGSYSSNMPW